MLYFAASDQQAIVDMAELKIIPTEEQIANALLHKPPGTIFKMIKQVGVVPNKKNMLSLLLDFAENQQGVPDLVRALRRAGIDVINDEELIFALQQRYFNCVLNKSLLYMNYMDVSTIVT